MSQNVEDLYLLEECFEWISNNKYKRVAIQLRPKHLKRAVEINKYFSDKAKDSDVYTDYPLEIFVSRSNTCCVDLLVTQHVPELDGIIHFGDVCLSKSEIQNQHIDIPILFAFEACDPEQQEIKSRISSLIDSLKNITENNDEAIVCVLADTSNIDYANYLAPIIANTKALERVEVADLLLPHHSWSTFSRYEGRVKKALPPGYHIFGTHILSHNIKDYSAIIYLGSSLSIKLSLQCSSDCYSIDLSQDRELKPINRTRLLNKRTALVSRLRDEEELKFGVIITNPLPKVVDLARRLEGYAKSRRHTIYFISMVQSIDECKMGNFDLCDAFVVVNSCSCSTVLESLVFNRPIITETEFRMACGFETEYGGITWPGSSTHLSEVDLENRRKVSDVSLALIQTRNELLERCSQARANKWSGLEWKPLAMAGEEATTSESLDIKDGLSGIASSYTNEPLQRES